MATNSPADGAPAGHPRGSCHAFGDDILGDLDAVGLAESVRRGDAHPRELAEAAVARSHRVEHALGAVVDHHFDHALATAHHARAGVFGGVPTFVKDMLDVKGLPTRWGTPALHGARPAKRHDPLVDQMIAMGMVVLGKSSMPEFGFTPSAEFVDRRPTRNPWNLGHSTGGSSSGAAALVAAGVVPIAHAADGGGSIRIPAAACGLVGLKPTRGRLHPTPYTRHQPVLITTDGVVTRTVRDTVAFYAEAERHHRNRRLRPIGDDLAPIGRPLRIAVTTETPVGAEPDAATRAAFEQTIELLEGLGHRIEHADMGIDPRLAHDFRVYWALNAFAVAKAGKFVLHPDLDSRELTHLTEGLARFFRRNALDAPGAIVRLRRSARLWSTQFARFDLMMTPTVSHVTPPIGHLGMDQEFDELFERMATWACYTPAANAAGGPAITLPLGHDDATDLPVGMMFMAAHGNERLLLEAALQLEQAAPFRTLAPAPAPAPAVLGPLPSR